MNNKFLKIFIPTIIIVMLFTLAYVITLNLTSKKGENKDNENVEAIVSVDSKKDDEIKKEEPEKKNVVLNSKIGTQILEKIILPSNYSQRLITLAQNGLTNDYMLLYTYSIINTDYTYNSFLKNLDDYSGSYILTSDFETVAKKYFGNNIKLEYKDIMVEKDYDKENGRYNILATGYANDKLDYVIQIPYKITQEDDKYYVECYEIYATNISDLEGQSYNEIYYDKDREKLIEKITDENFDNPDNQPTYIQEKIDNGTINKEKISKITYTVIKEEASLEYVITELNL